MDKKPRVERTMTVKNGVQVTVVRTKDGSYVESSCQCFGHPKRVHSNPYCPNIPKSTET